MENKIFEWIFKGSDNGSQVIAVKNQYDILKVNELMKEIGMFVTDKTKEEIIDWDDIKDNFLIRNKDGSWRLQSHFLGNGLSIEKLEQKINFLSEKDIKSQLLKMIELKKEFDSNFLKVEKEAKQKFEKFEKEFDEKKNIKKI